MTQQKLFESVPLDRFQTLTRDELIEFIKLQQDATQAILRDNARLRALNKELKQRTILVADQYVVLKNKLFGKSSERSPSSEVKLEDNSSKNSKNRKKKVQLPSVRYPNAPLIERDIEFKELPTCKCCGDKMKDSGMTEDSEYLTVIPEQFYVVRQRRHKYRCSGCHGNVQTAPAPPRIKEGSGYSDEMVIDVAMGKYCDLVPVERYATIAGRAGLKDLPPHSLIETTHYLADFVEPAAEAIKKEIEASPVLHADETPHRMLEGSQKKSWYLWGFATKKASYFEIHGTRSGSVASRLLVNAKCEYLMSDVFSGYAKAVRDANEIRAQMKREKIKNIYCNAHARRKFKESEEAFPEESAFYIEQYKEIYKLESEIKENPEKSLENRAKMEPFFKAMRDRSYADSGGVSEKSSIGKAMKYFLGNYDQLTMFLKNSDLPIDNNLQERLLRNPVIGRKTWYGTHSKRGAKTAAILFSIVESCKLNKVNPREYLGQLVKDMQAGKPCYTPAQVAAH